MSTLTVSQCISCGTRYISEPVYCDCGERTFSPVEVSAEGTVASYTTLHVVPPAFDSDVPYSIAIVALETDLHVAARVEAGQEVETGSTVTVERRGEVSHWVTETGPPVESP